MWDITLGDTQYNWFKKALEESDARFKFVFSHHVLGTGRGGVEFADRYEWGGYGKDGVWEFDAMRPGWELPIHQMMAENGITLFFQGHDHLFAHQELDGVVYQSLPNPADPTYTAFNASAYQSGEVLPNSGHLRVTVSASAVEVDYVRAFLAADENEGRKNGEVSYSYTVDAQTDSFRSEPSGLLGRPTDTSVTVNAISEEEVEVFFEFGTDSGSYQGKTEVQSYSPFESIEQTMEGLQPDTPYFYRMRFRRPGKTGFSVGEEHTFHTQRQPGKPFIFAVEADPHLDEGTKPDLYLQTLENISSDSSDFLIDLGDTFMSDKLATPGYDEIVGRHLLLRSFFDRICHSVPLFLVLGNHEGEQGWAFDGTSENMAVWAINARKLYYPNPVPDGFYSGNDAEEPIVGLRENYYAWEWGNAQFIVLDPYWYTRVKLARIHAHSLCQRFLRDSLLF